ncbi:AAA family ATPase, partial [Streptomyces sp. ME01-18h]|uniref:AAA family ATPase n=1 Tax=Streptomyces sp. ME01-18h TaxID=462920 RepID=UPI0039F6AA26
MGKRGHVPEGVCDLTHFTGRTWVLERVQNWLSDPDAPNVLLLSGDRGSGKTCVAARLAQLSFSSTGHEADPKLPPGFLTAIHFCDPLFVDTIAPGRVYQHVSDQLASRIPELDSERLRQLGPGAPIITQNIGEMRGGTVKGVENLNLADRNARLIFHDSIRRPLQALRERGVLSRPVVVLIDAIDAELEEEGGLGLPQALSYEMRRDPGLRLLVTSRPHSQITAAFPDAETIQLAGDTSNDHADVRAYVIKRLAGMPTAGIADLAERIAELGRGNFLYARQVVDQIARCDSLPADLSSFPLPDGLAELDRVEPRWDRLPPPDEYPGALRSLLSAQVSAAQNSPYTIRHASELDLSSVYVPQRLTERIDDLDAIDEDDGGIDSDLSDSTPRVPTVEHYLGTVLDTQKHVIITGGAGQGKSSLTLNLADVLSRAWLRMPTPGRPSESFPITSVPALPLRVTARALADRCALPWQQALADAITNDLGLQLQESPPPELFAASNYDACWLLIIDALDEIADPVAYRGVLDALAKWIANPDFPHRVLVTTRPLSQLDADQLKRSGAAIFALEPFKAEDLRDFARKWFKRRAAEGETLSQRFLDQVNRSRLGDVVRIPLLAAVAVAVFEDDPDKVLPSHRHQLYEKYLTYIFSGRPAEFSRQWSLLKDNLEDVDGGPDFADWLRRQRLNLVKHLSVIYLETDRSLLKAACNWTTEQARQADHLPPVLPPDWEEIIVVAATSTGLLVRNGSDLRFVHRSFAEHLAANVYADQLPAFDPSDERWMRWVSESISEKGADLAHSVFARHLSITPNGGLLDWLFRHELITFQVMAAELSSLSGPIPEEAFDAFVNGIYSWALWQTPGSNIAEISFKRALGAASGQLPCSAIEEVLLRIVNDGTVSTRRRIEAARILPPSNWREVESAFQGMQQKSDCSLFERAQLLQFMAAADTRHISVAAQSMFRALSDSPTDAERQRWLVQSLIALGHPYEQGVAERYRPRIKENSAEGRWSARTLAWLGPRYAKEAADALRQILRSRTADISFRGMTACTLASVGPHYTDEVSSTLLEVISGNSSANLGVRSVAARALIQVRPEYGQKVAEVMHEVLASRKVKGRERGKAAQILAGVEARHITPASGLLRDLLTDRYASIFAGWWAARALVRVGRRGEVATLLREMFTDADVSLQRRLWAARTLAALVPDSVTDAAQQLIQLLSNPSIGRAEQGMAAEVLISLGPQHAKRGSEDLLGVLSKSSSGAEERLQAIKALLSLGPHHGAVVVPALREVLADPSVKMAERRWAAQTLVGLGPEHVPGTAEALCGV